MADEQSTPPTNDPAPPPAPPIIQQETPPATGDLGDAGKKALDAERKARTEAEKAAKAATAELEKLRKSQMSESEKAVTEAEARGRQSTLAEIGTRLVDAEFRAVAAGRTLTPEALLSFDRGQFLDDAGNVNRDDLKTWVEANSSPVGNPRPSGNADLGPMQGGAPLTAKAADLAQIEKDMAASRR